MEAPILISIVKLVVAMIVFWAIKEKVTEKFKANLKKTELLKTQTLDHFFISLMRQVSADADSIQFEYYPEDDTWVMIVGELMHNRGEINPLWHSDYCKNITTCWKEFALFHQECE